MISTTRDSKRRVGGALLAAAIATGVGLGAVGTAPTANASCVSAFGLSSGPDCQSGFGSIAIAIGSDATAWANGMLGVSIAVGQQSLAIAGSGSFFTVAAALGTSAAAQTKGILQAVVSAGTKSVAGTGFGAGPLQFANVALNFGNHSNTATNAVDVSGFGNLGVNLGGDVMFVNVTGFLNNATNLFGSTDIQVNGGALSWAFNVFGQGNDVTAGPGFLAVAGSLGQTNAIIKQAPFGININGAGFPPSAAAINPAAKHGKPASTKASGTVKPRKSSSGKGTAHSARG